MADLEIEIAKNGFVVTVGPKTIARQTWAFENGDSLAKFMTEWAHGNEQIKEVLT